MTPTQQNIAIAKACGWKAIWDSEKYSKGINGYPPGYDGDSNDVGLRLEIPNYHADLNAMHEAEKALTSVQWVSYWSFLEPLACRPNNTSILHATAPQRAEAFLRTLGIFEEGEG